MLFRLLVWSAPVIAMLVGAAFVVPPGVPLLLRQGGLAIVGVGGIVTAERVLFGRGWKRIAAALGFVAPRPRAMVVALVVSLPMWLFLPIHGHLAGAPFSLARDWPAILLGVILVNGVTEEVIHRAFIFGHARATRSFGNAATFSAIIFAAQHVYLLFSIGALAGMVSVALASAVAFPLAFLYERGGNSLGAPALVHISSNAPMLLFVAPDAAGRLLLPHMSVVLASMYLGFALRAWDAR